MKYNKGDFIIGIIGAGTMGSGLVQVAAMSGYNVICYDTSSSAIDEAKSKIDHSLNYLFEQGKLHEQSVSSIKSKIGYAKNIAELSKSDFIIEAVIEDLSVKQNLFCSLESIVDEKTILATNTSSFSITSIASSCKYPQRVIGAHFFNPAPVMKLVEIIPGLLTSNSVYQKVKEIIEGFGKSIVKAKDTPGFIVNRIARPYYSEALRMLEEGIADSATIDWAMKEFGKFKMGPFELIDLIGNDINYKVTENIFTETYFDPHYKPSIIQKRMVEANLLGRKTGKGFYNYQTKEFPEPKKDEKLGQIIFHRILSRLINEAADAVFFNIATIEDIDTAVKLGANYPKGLFEWADEIGVMSVLKTISGLHNEYNEERYRPSVLLKRMGDKKFYNKV